MSSANDIPTIHPQPSNFIRQIIEEDTKSGKWQHRLSGTPQNLQSFVTTRFPPEPNGYLHIGHAKSIHLNFGLARDYKGRCHLRFDDTNPSTEDVEYERAIMEAVRWLGFDWGEHLYYASSYFPKLYECARLLISKGLAFVDDLSAEQMKAYRGTLTEAGRPSPRRNRPIEESLDLFARMKKGEFADGALVLRAKIDMASPNINMRDPIIYRIRHQHHYRTNNDWCIYPMYDYAHCISDAIEGITHSICTLEFQDHRPLYEWCLANLSEHFPRPHPQQIEFARLNLNHTITSKRKLLALVENKTVGGWDDPRMPTILGLRRRGFTPESISLFCERIGVAKSDSRIDMVILEDCLREDLNLRAPRRIAILDPVKLIIDNWEDGKLESIEVPNHPQKADWGHRPLHFGKEIWIERDDFMAEPIKGFHRLVPNGAVRLRYGYIVDCTSFETDEQGRITVIHATYDPTTKSGSGQASSNVSNAPAVSRKVKGNIHWLSAHDAKPAEVRLYSALFSTAIPDKEDNWEHSVVQNSCEIKQAFVEPALLASSPEAFFQFERNGYFCADRFDHRPNQHPVFNRATTLRDGWSAKT